MGKSKTCVYFPKHSSLQLPYIVSYHRGLDFFNALEGLRIFTYQLQHLMSTLITCFVMFHDLKIFEKGQLLLITHTITHHKHTLAQSNRYIKQVYTMCIAQRSCSGLIDSSKVLKIYLVILQSKVVQPSTGFCINAMMKFA